MKSVTEFANVTLSQALKAKASLTAEGKTPEEVQENLAQTYKLEGDKLKYFMAALDVAAANSDNLRRVVVMSLNEGENAPAKATKVEEHYYVPDFHTVYKAPPKEERGGKGGRRGGGGKGGRDGGRGGKEARGGSSEGPAASGKPASRPIPKAPAAPKPTT